MASYFLAPDPCQSTFFIPGGNTPANGGQLFFYAAGSSTKQTVYKDSAGNTAWANPIVLDSGGNLPAGGEVWFTSGLTYKVVFAPSNDTDPPASPYWTKDNLAGVNDVSTVGSEWLAGPTPTFVSATSFTLAGDQTTTFTVGRRVRTTNTGGTVYSRITGSVFGALTTVTLVNDSGALDAGLSAVSYGILNPVNPSIPAERSSTFRVSDSTDPSKLLSVVLSGITTSTQVNLTIQNTSGTAALTGDFAFQNLAGLNGRLLLPTDYITGYKITNNATSTAMDIAAGMATEVNNTASIITSTGIIGKTQGAFAAGASSGAKLSAAAMSSNTWYAWYALGGSSGAVDFGFDVAFPPASPTTTAAFPYYRYIGGRKTTASTTAWEQFIQHGDEVQWFTPPALDLNGAPSTANRTLTTMNVPVGIRVKWFGNAQQSNGGAADTGLLFTDPLCADIAVGITVSPLGSLVFTNGGAGTIRVGAQASCWTNTSSQIGIRGSTTATAYVQTLGWIDPRGKPV